MKNLLIVAHTPSPNTLSLAKSLESGALDHDEPVKTVRKTPFATDSEAISKADGIILFTTENFGYMSGALKDMFDRTYYSVIDTKRGLPYALVVRAGKDGTGTKRAVESIIKGLGWSKVQDAVILRGDFDPAFHEQTRELGQAFAIGLGEGMF